MKRTTILFACAALAMAGCSKNDGGHAPAGEVELRLAAGIEAATRGDVQSTAIVPGETVWAWVSDAGAEAGAGALYNAVKLTAGDGGTLAGTTTMYFPQTGNGVDIRALHGTFAAGTITEDQTAFPDGFDFTVATDQSGATGQSGTTDQSPEDDPNAADHTNYVRSDLLYAAADDVGRTQGAVQLKFYHMLSKLELRIKKGAGVTDDITGATLDNVAVDGTFTPGTAADLTQQTVRAGMIAAGTTTGAITLGTKLMGDDPENIVSNDAIVVPQEVAGKTMTFTLKSGAQLVYTLPEGKPFESGKKHVYTVTLTLTGLAVTSAVEPWTGTDPVDGEATMPLTKCDQLGAGTAAEPYQLTNAAQLQDLSARSQTEATLLSAHYLLTKNITLPSVEDTDSPSNWTPIGTYENPFTGTFDGNGCTLTGLTVSLPNSDYVGLFCWIGRSDNPSGTVKNLTLAACKIEGEWSVGGIAGRNFGTIENCRVSGTVTGTGNDVGGIAGVNLGRILACSNAATVTGIAKKVGTSNGVGGIAGGNSGTIENCDVSGTVTGTGFVGGIAGQGIGGRILACSNAAEIEGSGSTVGGIAGYYYSGTVIACYNTGKVSGASTVGGVVGNNDGSLISCYNTGSTTGNPIAGWSDGRSITSCYYPNGDSLFEYSSSTPVTDGWSTAITAMNNSIGTYNETATYKCNYKYTTGTGTGSLPFLVPNE